MNSYGYTWILSYDWKCSIWRTVCFAGSWLGMLGWYMTEDIFHSYMWMTWCENDVSFTENCRYVLWHMIRVSAEQGRNMLIFHMRAPLIGSHPPTTPPPHPRRADLVPPTHCSPNMSAHQETDSNLLCVHDDFQPSRFTASDPNTWMCPPTGD